MAEQTHIIHTQLLELHIGAEAAEDHQAMLQALEQLAAEGLAASIGSCLDHFSSPQAEQYIDLLEVHLTIGEGAEWRFSLLEQFPQALNEALQQQLAIEGTHKNSLPANGGQQRHLAAREEERGLGAQEAVLTRAHRVGMETATQYGLQASAGAEPTVKSHDILLHYLLTGRLLWSASDDFNISDWAEILTSYGFGVMPASQEIRQKQLALRQVLTNHPLARQRLQRDFSPERLMQLFPNQQVIEEDWPQAIEEAMQASVKQWKGEGIEAAATSPNESNSLLEKRFLRHVGLLLLHPFLEDYLTQVGVVQAGKILDFDRAASLLAALALGRSPEGEWELETALLLLPKTEKRMVGYVQLTPEELVFTHKTIGKAILTWPTIGSTSVEGFRESFLQRTGLLEQGSYGGIITWENRPFDMLLDYLPWRLSYIRLPWMDSFLTLNTGR